MLIEFDKLTDDISRMGTKAQATFLYKLVQKLGPGVLRSNVRYSFDRLDAINAELPEDHPFKRTRELQEQFEVTETVLDNVEIVRIFEEAERL